MLKDWISALSVYKDRRLLAIICFGFASGLPLPLVGQTLSARLRDGGVSLADIGLASLVGTAYGLKFLWAPLIDRVSLPFLTTSLGQRRSWLLLSQLGLMLTIPLIAFWDVSSRVGVQRSIALALVVAFLSATQDIAVDAYRIEILEQRKFGAGAAAVQFGYRLGMLTGGGGCLIVADFAGWSVAYVVMAVLIVVGIFATLTNPEPPVRAFNQRPSESLSQRLFETVIRPFSEFITRPGSFQILLFVAFYRYGDALLGVMANPFYLDLHFTKTEIGLVSKFFGTLMTLIGTAFAGVLVARLGIMRSLLIGGFLQAGSNIMFVLLAMVGHSLPLFAITIAVENISGGLASGAFVAYLSNLCNLAFTATQYALLSSLAALVGRLLSAGGGIVAEHVGWPSYFAVTVLAAVPGLVLLALLRSRSP